jgi:hypothetical protein
MMEGKMKGLRVYTDMLDNEKIAKMNGNTFRIFIFLLLVAREQEQDGTIILSEKDIAWRVRQPLVKLRKAIRQLIDLKILSNEDGQLTFINWSKRQYKSDDITARVKRFRNVTCNVTKPLHETPPETETEAETEEKRNSKRKKTSPPCDAAPGPGSSKPEGKGPILETGGRSGPIDPRGSDEQWFNTLKANPAYAELDVETSYHKLLAWCNANGKKPTRRRFVNWLNREERPLQRNGNAYESSTYRYKRDAFFKAQSDGRPYPVDYEF